MHLVFVQPNRVLIQSNNLTTLSKLTLCCWQSSSSKRWSSVVRFIGFFLVSGWQGLNFLLPVSDFHHRVFQARLLNDLFQFFGNTVLQPISAA